MDPITASALVRAGDQMFAQYKNATEFETFVRRLPRCVTAHSSKSRVLRRFDLGCSPHVPTLTTAPVEDHRHPQDAGQERREVLALGTPYRMSGCPGGEGCDGHNERSERLLFEDACVYQG
jgi:hypothetical protein